MLMAWCISHIIAYWAASLSLALLSLASSSLSQTLGPSTPPGSIFEPLLAQSLLRDEGIEIGTCTETSLGCCCVPLATMAPHSSTVAWKIPWTEHPGRMQSMGSQRVGHDWATLLSCIGEGNGNPLQFLAWRIPGMGEPGGLPSLGLHRVGHDWSDLAAAAAACYVHR